MDQDDVIEKIAEEFQKASLFVHPVLDRSDQKFSLIFRADMNKIKTKEYLDIITTLKQLKTIKEDPLISSFTFL